MPARYPRPQFLRGIKTPTLHTTRCAATRRSLAFKIWPQADTYTSHQLAIYVATAHLQPCKRCKPISTLTTWERVERRTTA